MIKVEDKRNKPAPAFEEVKDQITASLIQVQLKDTVQKLRSSRIGRDYRSGLEEVY